MRYGRQWDFRESPHFIFWFVPDSYPAQRISSISERAEASWRALHAFIGDGRSSPTKIEVYLDAVVPHPEESGGSLAAGSYVVPDRGEIWVVYRPESQGEGLEEGIAHFLVFEPMASAAGQVPFIRTGLVSVLSAGGQAGSKQAHAPTAKIIQKGQPIAIQPRLAEQSLVSQGADQELARSFFAFLLDWGGPGALREFLTQFDPRQPDRAAGAVYRLPIAALQEAWLAQAAGLNAQSASIKQFLGRLLPYARPYPRYIVEIFTYLLFSIGFGLALQLSIKFLIDNVIAPPGNVTLLIQMLSALFIAFLINAVTSLRRSYLTAWVGEKILIQLRLDTFEHLQKLSAGFYSRSKVGDIVSRMSNDLLVVQRALSQALLSGPYYALSFAVAVVAIVLLDWRLSLVVILTLPLLFICTRLLSERVTNAARARSERLGDVTNMLQENLNANSVVRAFNLQDSSLLRYYAELEKLFKASVRMVLLGSLYGLSGNLVTSLIQLLVLGIGAYLILTGNFTVGALFSFMGLLGSVTSPVEQSSDLVQTLQQAAGSMQRVVEILDAEIEVSDAPDATPLAPVQKEIALEHVTFSYTGNEPQLQDLSIVIPAGKRVALVGPSGSGKSTVIQLLLRFYDPQEGRVLFDGVDVRAVKQESLHSVLSIVFQDTFVFNTTIRENLRYAKMDATEDEIVAAARKAEIHDFILTLPSGYDTVVGERGGRLSGGQRQRLAIARALLCDPSVLLLDEATSALDPQTEKQIQLTLNDASKDRTTIMVTHRLAQAAAADYIFVLDRGGILAEQGTHADLMAAAGLYARLYREQQGAAELGVPITLEVTRLRRVPLFAELPADALATLAANLTPERYASGEIIGHQGDVADRMCVIERGSVEAFVETPAGERSVGTMHEGDYFGEIALLLDKPRMASARALGPVELLALSKSDFEKLLAAWPAIGERLQPVTQQRIEMLQASA